MSTNLGDRTLWADVARTRYFLIPDDHEPPRGSFVVWTLTGRRLDADEAALVPYEITPADAKAWVTAEFGKLLETTRTAADQLVNRIKAATAKLKADAG